MISDKVVHVKTDRGDYDIVITGEQLGQTVRRRIASLLPNVRILDMTETNGEQTDLMTKPKK